MNMKHMMLVLPALLMPAIVIAHPFHVGDVGLTSGFLHPFSGVDHLLAMLAVGMLAMSNGWRTAWRWPATFLLMAGVGFWVGSFVGHLASVEWMITVSLVMLGGMLVSGQRGSLIWLPLIALFGWVHGLAHGVELSLDGGSFDGFAGFMLATACLHATGMGLAMLLREPARLRLCGMAITVIGLVGLLS